MNSQEIHNIVAHAAKHLNIAESEIRGIASGDGRISAKINQTTFKKYSQSFSALEIQIKDPIPTTGDWFYILTEHKTPNRNKSFCVLIAIEDKD